MRVIGRFVAALMIIGLGAVVVDGQESRASSAPDRGPGWVRVSGRLLGGPRFPYRRTQVIVVERGRPHYAIGRDTFASAADGTFEEWFRRGAWTFHWVGGPANAGLGRVDLDLGEGTLGTRTSATCEIALSPKVRLVRVTDARGAPIPDAVVGSALPLPAPLDSLDLSVGRRANTDVRLTDQVSDQHGWAWPRELSLSESFPIAVWAEGYRPLVLPRVDAVERVTLVDGVPARLRFPRWFDPPAKVGFYSPTDVTVTLELDPTGAPEWWHHGRVSIRERLTVGTSANELATKIAPGSYLAFVRMVRQGFNDRMSRLCGAPSGVAVVSVSGTIVVPDSKDVVTIDVPVLESQYLSAVDEMRR